MTPLAASVRRALVAVADPARSPGMQAYMKSAMPYLGVSTGPRRRALKPIFADLHHATAAEWQRDVLDLWRGASFREELYAAIELTGHRAARPFQRIAALPIYEEMIVTGAWWDHVDPIASQRLWAILQADRPAMTAAMRAWSTDDDLWKRRAAIICQLHAKRETDLDLLYACIEPSIASRFFFLAKAIGWALRQHARTDPAEVRRYVAANAARLSPLSRREALKHLPP